MCLVAFALDAHPRHRLVFTGNRDESFDRPASPLAPWPDTSVIAGRDLEAGGTWLGVTKRQRWAVLTNVRDPLHPRPATRSRGSLPADFLTSSRSAREYATDVAASRSDYDGFNLVVGDLEGVYAVSTRHDEVLSLGPGVYGLSNDRLDTPWPKVKRARRDLRRVLEDETVETDSLLDIMDETSQAADDELPDTGVGLEVERMLSPMRIVAGDYGTRVSTAFVLEDGSGRVAEQTWHRDGTKGGLVEVAW